MSSGRRITVWAGFNLSCLTLLLVECVREVTDCAHEASIGFESELLEANRRTRMARPPASKELRNGGPTSCHCHPLTVRRTEPRKGNQYRARGSETPSTERRAHVISER